jgi:apolipoprotein N-acyltransferase
MEHVPSNVGGRFARTLLLLLSSAALLTLSFEPFGQWYLAWIALVPWVAVVADSPSACGAMLRGFSGGVLFFALNLWWLWTASVPGLVVLIAYFSLFWGAAAGAIYHLGLPPSAAPTGQSPQGGAKLGTHVGHVGRIGGVAVLWVAFEWLRCHLIEGCPWLPLGVTQTPCVLMCQVADLGGPSIISFWVMLINALIASIWLYRNGLRDLGPAVALVLAVLLLTFAYGGIRLATTNTTPGPRAMMLQSNFRHLRGGAPTATPQDVVQFFLTELENKLVGQHMDLVVLPEAAFPPINEEARTELARAAVGPFLGTTNTRLTTIAARLNTSLLVGGNAVTGWTTDGSSRVGSEIRNAAYYFPAESPDDVRRYDKIHLVPFSERAPFARGPEWLQRWGLAIAASRASQPLTAGDLETTAPFILTWRPADADEQQRLRFIAPICLEAVDSRVVARMMRVAHDEQQPVKLIANLSNDGWFATQEKYQHFQALVLRSIEHRAPLVRSSNTGISGWIDSTGRVRDMVAVNTADSAIARIELDDRITLYSRYGDVFVGFCMALATLGAVFQFLCQKRKMIAELAITKVGLCAWAKRHICEGLRTGSAFLRKRLSA